MHVKLIKLYNKPTLIKIACIAKIYPRWCPWHQFLVSNCNRALALIRINAQKLAISAVVSHERIDDKHLVRKIYC